MLVRENNSRVEQAADLRHAANATGECFYGAAVILLVLVDIILVIGPVLNYWSPLQKLLA